MYTLEDHYLASGSVGGGAETTKKPRRCGPSRLSAPSGGQKLSRTATSMPFANKRTTKRHEFTIFYILHMNKWRTEMRTRIDKVVFIDWASELTLSYNFYFPFLRGGADDLYFILFFLGVFLVLLGPFWSSSSRTKGGKMGHNEVVDGRSAELWTLT